VADAFRRRVHELHATTISMYQSNLKEKILEVAKSYLQYMEIITKLQQGILQQKIEDYKLGNEEFIMYMGIIYIQNSQELKILILIEMHNVPYVGYPCYQKTLAIVKRQYYWPWMKKEVVDFIAKCLECQKVKAEHRNPAGLLQPIHIPEWKWEFVIMDFITKLPRTNKWHDLIMVVVDKLTKASHFIPVKITHKVANVDIYMRSVAQLHGIPKTIVFDRDPKFTSNFWKGLFRGF
jgi:hypothetical protein